MAADMGAQAIEVTAYHRSDMPVCEPPGERSRLRSRAAGADEPELVDLLRLHTPTPDVVIVRVSGTVDRRGAQLLVELARKQFNRAPHVVIDLDNVSAFGPRGVAVLLVLHQEATARGTDLRIRWRRARGGTPPAAPHRPNAAASARVNGRRGYRKPAGAPGPAPDSPSELTHAGDPAVTNAVDSQWRTSAAPGGRTAP